MSHSTELRNQLVQGIAELESDLARLRAALAALDGGSTPRRPASPSKPTPRRSRRRQVHGTVVVPAGKIESLLRATDGTTTAELSRQTNGGHEQILSILKELEQAGKAYRSGTRRSTKWHAGAGAHANGSGSAKVAESAVATAS